MSSMSHEKSSSRARRWALVPALVLAVALSAAASALPDVVHTTDGRRLEGTIVKETRREVVVDTRLGRVTVPRADVDRIERGKTPRQEFDARFAAAEDDVAALLELSDWAAENDLASGARKCMRRVLELDDQNDRANELLGNVRYKGEWMTPRERDRARARDEAAERREKGLVEHEGEWVTPEDKARLEAGLVRYEGEWLTEDEVRARQGFVRLRLASGAEPWVPLATGRAAERARATAKAVDVLPALAPGPDHVVLGPWSEEFLAGISAGLVGARARFDAQFADVPPGIDLLGGECAELYVWGRDSRPYHDSVDALAARTTTVGAAWREAVKDTHGWVFWDPTPVSSVRAVARPEFHLAGHTYYHWGHILLNRHRYDGRLLPPWFGEGYASLCEWWVHGQNTVVLKADASGAQGGTVARGKEPPFGRAALLRGDWQSELLRALEDKDPRLGAFDTLARKSPGELNAVDVAMSMGIVLWLEGLGDGALDRFHASLKASAPAPPDQVLVRGADRLGRYDDAFRAAAGVESRTADRLWRKWFLDGGHRASSPEAGDR